MTKGKCIECSDTALESWEATNSSVVCDHALKHPTSKTDVPVKVQGATPNYAVLY